MGGDAFCHPQLAELLNQIGSKYLNDRIEQIHVEGNAVVKLGAQILSLLKKYNATVRITDYRESTEIQKIDETMELLKNAGVALELINQGQWLKVDREEAEYIKDAAGRKAMYDLCRYTGSALIKKGRFYSCCIAGYRDDRVSLDFQKLED